LKLNKPRCHLNTRKYLCAHRIVHIWYILDDNNVAIQLTGSRAKMTNLCKVEGSTSNKTSFLPSQILYYTILCYTILYYTARLVRTYLFNTVISCSSSAPNHISSALRPMQIELGGGSEPQILWMSLESGHSERQVPVFVTLHLKSRSSLRKTGLHVWNVKGTCNH